MIKDTSFDERSLNITVGELPSAKPWGIAASVITEKRPLVIT
jgi:hypothetical protein